MIETTYQVIGCRVPRDFFVTQGHGESNHDIHAGSYHLALQAAGVESYNHMKYSSILPGIAREVAKPENYTHGSVLETIAAQCDAEAGEKATAGIIYAWLLDRRTETKFGGIVCERAAHAPPEEVETMLRTSLQELYSNSPIYSKYQLQEPRVILEHFIPQKKHGTALVLMGFVNYVVPVLESR